MNNTCTLSGLYKTTELYKIAYDWLNEFFTVRFRNIIQDVSNVMPYLIGPAHYFENDIKEMVIEHGRQLTSYIDLQSILESLNYLEFENFKSEKLSFENRTGLFDGYIH
jgi:hypothetical protein